MGIKICVVGVSDYYQFRSCYKCMLERREGREIPRKIPTMMKTLCVHVQYITLIEL
jgi:hypothetical protein